MDVGFVGLGNIGFPIARRLLGAGYRVLVCDKRDNVVAAAVAAGARAMMSPKEIADQTETVLASLPSLQASIDVAAGPDGVADGRRVRPYVDLSTVGSRTARDVADALAARRIAALDSPVSGGVAGAENGTLAVMVSGPRARFDVIRPVLETIGTPIFVSEKPGAAQTAGEQHAGRHGIGDDGRGGGDGCQGGPGSGGFATGLMVKDVRLYLEEAAALGLPTDIAATVGRVWESVLREEGADSDFTCVVKPIEAAAGVVVEARP
jgi:3-hydroxyisobutyrate dehydrogenase-like beta-hydroxyacid dehydrogenase